MFNWHPLWNLTLAGWGLISAEQSIQSLTCQFKEKDHRQETYDLLF